MRPFSPRTRSTAEAVVWIVAVLSVVWMICLEAAGPFKQPIFGISIRKSHPSNPACVAAVAFVVLAWLRSQARSREPIANLVVPAPSRRATLWALLGICAFGGVVLHAQLAQLRSVPDLGDPLFSIWRMGWLSHWLHGDPRPLFSPNIFYPQPLTLTYSDSMLLPALTAVPLLALGVPPVVAYNILFMSGFVLSGFAMYLLVARLTGSARAAFISAILFAFYPFRFEHYSHLELQMAEWMPLALLAIQRVFDTHKARYVILAALCVVAQLYSSMYFAVFFVLYLVPFTAILWIVNRPPLRRLWPGVLAAGLLGIVLVLPLARPYTKAQQDKGDRNVDVVTSYSADPVDYLSPHPRSAMYYGVMPRDRFPERALFPGVMALTLAAIALVPPIGAVQLAYAAGLLFAFDASLGFHGVIYPHLYAWLDPVRGMRVPARFSLLFGMTLAVLAGFGCLRLFVLCRTQMWRTVAFAVLVVAIGVDLHPRLDLEPVWGEPPPIYQALADVSGVVLAEFPMDAPHGGFTPNVPYMYFSLWHWKNMVNGYSGFSPPDYDRFLATLQPFPETSAIDALKARGVTHVSVNCAFYGQDCQAVLDQIDASPRFRRIVSARWERDVVRLYELVR